jgi:hypothetical protein
LLRVGILVRQFGANMVQVVLPALFGHLLLMVADTPVLSANRFPRHHLVSGAMSQQLIDETCCKIRPLCVPTHLLIRDESLFRLS